MIYKIIQHTFYDKHDVNLGLDCTAIAILQSVCNRAIC